MKQKVNSSIALIKELSKFYDIDLTTINREIQRIDYDNISSLMMYEGRIASAYWTELAKILVPYWEGGDRLRNELTLSIAGFIARSGGTEEDSIFVLSKLCKLTAKGYDHIPGAKYAFHLEGNVKGFRSLKKLMEVIGNE